MPLLGLLKNFGVGSTQSSASAVDPAALMSHGRVDRRLTIMVSMLAAYVVFRTTFVPVMRLSFFADDFAFLNWTSRLDLATWLAGFIEPGHFSNLTYRPLAAVIYLVYLTGSATLCYSLLASLYGINIVLLFLLYRRLANLPIAGLAVILFTASFIYFDAAHKVYNLITQATAVFFLTSLHCFLSAGEPFENAGRNQSAAYVFYALSLLTYEITLFGFVIFFILALRQECAAGFESLRRRSAITRALHRSWIFGAVSAAYLAANLFSPIRAAHLRDHAIPLSLTTVPLIVSRAWAVLKNTLAWIVTIEWARFSSFEFAALSLLLAVVITILLMRATASGLWRNSKTPPAPLLWAASFGGLWYLVLLLPGAVSTYFDYRMIFLAYAGLSLSIAACLSLIHGGVATAVMARSRFVQWSVAGTLSVIATIWMMSNLSLAERMNRNLIGAGNQQGRILTLLRPYLAAVPNGSVIAVRYEHKPSRALPYPYLASPFAEDYALADALDYYFGKRLDDASLFFQPDFDQFEVGRFSFARKDYPYERLVLFDFGNNQLSLQSVVKTTTGKEIALPLAVRIADGFDRQMPIE